MCVNIYIHTAPNLRCFGRRIRSSMYLYIYTYVFIYIYIYIHMYMYIYALIYTYVCIYIYMHITIYTYIHVYICTYIHTHSTELAAFWEAHPQWYVRLGTKLLIERELGSRSRYNFTKVKKLVILHSNLRFESGVLRKKKSTADTGRFGIA